MTSATRPEAAPPGERGWPIVLDDNVLAGEPGVGLRVINARGDRRAQPAQVIPRAMGDRQRSMVRHALKVPNIALA
jgi:hypothetical protein